MESGRRAEGGRKKRGLWGETVTGGEIVQGSGTHSGVEPKEGERERERERDGDEENETQEDKRGDSKERDRGSTNNNNRGHHRE